MRGIVVLFVWALAATAQAAELPCRSTPAPEGIVATVRDGRTLMLTDGRELRLAAIEAGDESRNALAALAPAGTRLRLARLDQTTDRYGRLVVFARPGEGAPTLQESLLAAGAARVSARSGEMTCLRALLALEGTARRQRLGLWADPNFAPLAADKLAGSGVEAGRFVLVEGRVRSVRQSGSTLYVNFGPRWTRDFAVSIPQRLERGFAAEGMELRALEGRRVRVRGWLEQRTGPIIDVSSPGQIERAD